MLKWRTFLILSAMNHKNRKDVYKRNLGNRRSARRYILYVEGENTEDSYFKLLKKANCKIVPVIIRGHGISHCVDFVNESENHWNSMPKERRNEYDRRWLVFDADGRTDFSKGIKLARKKGFGVAFSNMCIEYWFLLHFCDHDGRPLPMIQNSHSAAQIREINRFIKQYNRNAVVPVGDYDSKSKTIADDFFDLMMADDPVVKKSRIVSACERAKSIHEIKKANGSEFSESVTTIYELLIELGVIEETKDGFRLYRK